jgi:hypothetical protein
MKFTIANTWPFTKESTYKNALYYAKLANAWPFAESEHEKLMKLSPAATWPFAEPKKEKLPPITGLFVKDPINMIMEYEKNFNKAPLGFLNIGGHEKDPKPKEEKKLPPITGHFTNNAFTVVTGGAGGSGTIEQDPYGKKPSEPGAKVDAGKNRVWLFMSGFPRALEEVSKVTTVGAEKYTPNGWATVPNGSDRYMEAFGRHLIAMAKGEKYDSNEGGTGCTHKSQMIWNLLASLELDLRNE